MDNDSTPGALGSNAVLGGAAPKRAEALHEMIARLERQQFEEWATSEGLALNRHRHSYAATSTAWCWDAWRARGALQSKCRGVAHPGCEYLAACGGVCNKCGQSV